LIRLEQVGLFGRRIPRQQTQGREYPRNHRLRLDGGNDLWHTLNLPVIGD